MFARPEWIGKVNSVRLARQFGHYKTAQGRASFVCVAYMLTGLQIISPHYYITNYYLFNTKLMKTNYDYFVKINNGLQLE